MRKIINHGDTADTAKNQINHGDHGGHRERQGTVLFLSVVSVSSVVNAFDFRCVAVVKLS
jgi:hypothetical protein